MRCRTVCRTMAEPLLTLEPETAVGATGHPIRKSHGVHYTPAGLAGFVARRALPSLDQQESAVVLDPACGDGELLLAVATAAKAAGLPAPRLVGIDRDEAAVVSARRRLADASAASIALRCGDFLTAAGHQPEEIPATVDLVISNPPYVRTQVLGTARAQALARQFDLTGRVDLYHAFVAAMTTKLGEVGTLVAWTPPPR